MRVCLINPPSIKKRPVSRSMAGGLGFDSSEEMVLPPIDLAILASRLREAGIDIDLIDGDALGCSESGVLQQLDKSYDWIVSLVSLPTVQNDCQFAASLKTKAKKIAVKTAVQDYEILEKILVKSRADIVIYAECDLHIDQILNGTTVSGIAYFDNQGKFVFHDADYIENLDSIPQPARDLLPNEKYSYPLLGNGITTLQTSRGCPFPCSYYCPYPLVEGKSWRYQSAERVYNEIEALVRRFGIQKILFRDAVFTLDRKRVDSICDMIMQNKLDITWWCETRVDCLDEHLVEKMKHAGCLGINIGVETGDEEVMKHEAKSGLTLEKLRKLRDKAYEIGMKLHFLLSIGFPQETKKSIVDTFDLIRMLRPDSLGITVITPYPGTPLYVKAKRKGWIESYDWRDYGGHQIVMHTDNLSRSDIAIALDFLYKGYELMKMKSAGSSGKISSAEEDLYRELLAWACDLSYLRKRLIIEKNILYKAYTISKRELRSILDRCHVLIKNIMPPFIIESRSK